MDVEKLEELGIKYWDINHSTLELEREYKKKLSSLKAEMRAIEKEFKKHNKESGDNISVGSYAYKSLTLREAREDKGKGKDENKI